MHDPLTQILRGPGFILWHKDPERDGSDDSCDWWGRHRKLNACEQAIVEAMWDLETLLDNPPHFVSHEKTTPEHRAFYKLKEAIRLWKRRRFRLHPRWHVWHWRITLYPLFHFKRWAFSRCEVCGGRFMWGYAPSSRAWNGTGPLWFRSEECVRHAGCALQPPAAEEW